MIVKWTQYTDGIRTGFFNCLLALINRYEKTDWTRKEILIDLKAIIKDIDLFIEYGESVELIYTERDKKKKPTKGKIYKPNTSHLDLKRKEAISILLDILEKGGNL